MIDDIDLETVYDLPGEDEDVPIAPKYVARAVASARKVDTRTDQQRFDDMYKRSINIYEEMLDDADIPHKDKERIAAKLLEMYGMLGKQKAEKVYNLQFSEDYMAALLPAVTALVATLKEVEDVRVLPTHTPED